MEVSNVSLLSNALKKLRIGVPKMEFMKSKHESCANLDDGSCRVFHFTNLDPKGAACPHFKAKKQANAETIK